MRAARARLALLAAGLLACLVLAGCSEAPSTVLRFGLAASPVTLDPRFATDAASTRINRLLYEQLVDFDERFQPVPALAEWRRLAPMHYRFVLRSARHRFHDGATLTARDVKATYDSVLDPATGSPHRGGLRMIERIEVHDARTVDFHLNRADALFPGRLVIGVLPRARIASRHRFAREPIGSGAFRFLEWPEDGRLRIRRESDDQTVEFVRVPSPTVRVLKLLRGEIDMLQGDLPYELVEWLAAREDVDVTTHRGTNFAYLGFNLQDPVVGQLAVRRAIAHAIDRPAIIRHVLGGAARPANAILTPDHWAGHPDLPRLGYDPDRARALLREAGFGDGRPAKVVYKTSSDPFRVRLATIVQEQLGRVGIEVDLRSYDWGTFYGDVKAGRFQMYSLAWVGIKMPDIFRYALHSDSVPPTGANRGRFSSPLADSLIEAAEQADTLAGQAALYHRLQEHLLEHLPYVPLWYEDQVYVSRRGISGYRLANDGNYDGLSTVRRTSGDASS